MVLKHKVVVAGCSLVVLVLLAAACSSSSTDTASTGDDIAAATVTPEPESTVEATTSPLPTSPVVQPAPTPTPTVIPTTVPTATPTPTPVPPINEDQQVFCEFMGTRYFWEPDADAEFLALVPENVPTSVLRPFRAREVLSTPGLGDPKENSLASMVLITDFASNLGRYLNNECPGFDWVDLAATHSGDADFVPVPDPLVPSSELDLCAGLEALDAALETERDNSGPVQPQTAQAAQVFASAIDPAAPFEVLAFSHLLLTQATLSSNRTTFGLYLRVAFGEGEDLDLVDEEAVAVYFDETCPTVRDTRLWLTPPRAAGAIAHPVEGEGLPDGWETVPPEDIISPFSGDLRTLPVGEFTPLQTSYPPFEHNGVEFTSLGVDWVNESTEPAQGVLFLQWIYTADELPFDVTRAAVVGPDGTRYQADAERSFIQPELAQLVFVLDFIPESLDGVGFGIIPQ